jgi:hypothetical protein
MKNVINYIQLTIFAGFSFIKTNKAEAEEVQTNLALIRV